MTTLPPAKIEHRATPVGGPRHYRSRNDCAERKWHRMRGGVCADCWATGTPDWERKQLRREGDFLKTLVDAIEDLAGGKAA